MKLIDKDALIAEINRQLEYANNGISYAQAGIEKRTEKYESDLNVCQHCQSICNNILSFIDTLEVKEVDFEKYYHDLLQKEWFNKNCGRTISEMMFFTAKHFFELGLKVQKEV